MRKLLNNPWFVGTMAVLAFAFVLHSVWPTKPNYVPASTDGTETNPGEVATDVGDGTAVSIPAALKALPIAPAVRDPFAMVTVAVAEKSAVVTEKVPPPDVVDNVHVSAVWIQKDNNLALINGRVVAVGDEFGHLKVESASSEGVWLTHWKGRNFVSVGSDFSLSTPVNQSPLSTTSL